MRRFLGSCCVGKISDDPGEIQVAPHSKPLLRCLLGLGLHSVNYSYCSFSCPHHLRCFGTCCADDVCFGREQFTIDVSEPRYFFVVGSHWAQSMLQQRHHYFEMGPGWKHYGASLGSLGFERGFANRIAHIHQYRRTRCDRALKSDSQLHASRDEDNFLWPLIHSADYETTRK